MRRMVLIICLCGLWVWAAQPVLAAEPETMEVQPSELDIDTFFTGGRVNITGRVPASAEVVIEITGPLVDTKCDLKGRVGPFWMTKQTVHLEKVPSLYSLLAPEGNQWEERVHELGLGFDRLKTSLEVTQSELPREEVVQMLVDLKKSEGLFNQNFGAVSYSGEQDGSKSFQATYDFPQSTQAGTYDIKAIVIKDGAVTRQLTEDFKVKETGFIKFIDDLSWNQRLVYGVLAVVIALFAGGIMGLIFKGGGGH